MAFSLYIYKQHKNNYILLLSAVGTDDVVNIPANKQTDILCKTLLQQVLCLAHNCVCYSKSGLIIPDTQTTTNIEQHIHVNRHTEHVHICMPADKHPQEHVQHTNTSEHT